MRDRGGPAPSTCRGHSASAWCGGAPASRLPLLACLPPATLPPQLKQEELQLLRPVAARGQRETKKQALKRALALQRAGVSLPSDVRLLQERERPAVAMGEEGSSSDEEEEGSGSEEGSGGSGSEGEEEQPAAKKQRRTGAEQQQQQQQPPAAQAAAAGKAQAKPARQQVTAEAAAAQAAAQQQRAAAALREAAAAAKAQLGVSEQRDEEFPAQQAQQARQGMPAGPGGQPRVVMVQRRPEIQEVRWGPARRLAVLKGRPAVPVLGCVEGQAGPAAPHAVGAGCAHALRLFTCPACSHPQPVEAQLPPLPPLLLPPLGRMADPPSGVRVSHRQGGAAHHWDGAGGDGGCAEPRCGRAVRRDGVRQDHPGAAWRALLRSVGGLVWENGDDVRICASVWCCPVLRRGKLA